MQNPKAQAVHDLICDMLRGPHIRQMSGADLAVYVYKAGASLHNLPFALTGEQSLSEAQLREINELDPVADLNDWGPLASRLAQAFCFDLPPLK